MMNFYYFFLIIFAIFILFAGTYNLIFLEKVTKQQNDKARAKALKKQRVFKENSNKLRIKMLVNIFVNIAIGLALLITSLSQLDVSIDNDNSLTLLIGSPSSNQNYQVVEEIIQDYIVDSKPLTMIVGFVDKDKQYLFGFGNVGVNGDSVTKDSVYEIGSISKAITGLMLASSIENNLISLSDTVEDCQIEPKLNQDSVVNSIMIQNLATHTSGLDRLPLTNGFVFDLLVSGMFGSNPYQRLNETEVIKSMNGLKKLNDDSWEYSNYGAGIMGMCLASINENSYEELLQETIAKPLGLTHTSSVYQEDVSYVNGYRSVLRVGRYTLGLESAPWLLGEGIVSAGGIRSSGGDMLKLLNSLIDDDFGFYNLATTPRLRINDNREIALFWLIDEIENGQAITWHNGMTGGYSSFIGMNENSQGVFILTNQTNDVTELGFSILESIAV